MSFRTIYPFLVFFIVASPKLVFSIDSTASGKRIIDCKDEILTSRRDHWFMYLGLDKETVEYIKALPKRSHMLWDTLAAQLEELQYSMNYEVAIRLSHYVRHVGAALLKLSRQSNKDNLAVQTETLSSLISAGATTLQGKDDGSIQILSTTDRISVDSFREWIDQRMKLRGIATYSDLAAKMGITISRMSNHLKSTDQLSTLVLSPYANYFDVKVSDIINEITSYK